MSSAEEPQSLETTTQTFIAEDTLDGKLSGYMKNWNNMGSKIWEFLKIPSRVPSVEEYNLLFSIDSKPAREVDISKFDDLQLDEGVVNGYLNCGKASQSHMLKLNILCIMNHDNGVFFRMRETQRPDCWKP